jgi:hypothetical protein
MIKKILFLTLLIISITQSTFSQESEGGFDVNKMFVGGTVVLGLGFGNNSQFTIGGNPEIGYSIFQSVDLGICGNYVYSSSTFSQETTSGITKEKTRVTLSGLGVFTRIHITDGFFVQLQPEFNTLKYRRFLENPDITIEEGSYPSSSFLAGVGFGSRDVGQINYFTTILIDLQKDKYSPYRTYTGEISPVIRSGINFYFGRGKKKR